MTSDDVRSSVDGFGPCGSSGARPLSRALAALLLAAVVLATPVAAPAQQAEDAAGSSAITPFPENDTYRMTVIGDAFAEGLLWPLLEGIGPEQRVELQRRARTVSGLMRQSFEEDMKGLEALAAKDAPHIAVVMVGAYDRTPLRSPQTGRAMTIGAPDWRETYGRRVDRLMKALRRHRTAVYWVGLPVMRRPEWNEDIQMMNEIVREKAFVNGARYVDAYASFVDDAGNYDNYGPDLTGKIRRMREADGILFTADANRKLAHFVERELKRDLGQARSERSIPLLGAEAEQRRIVPRPTAATAKGATAPRAPGGAGAAANPQPAPGGPATAAAGGGDQKTDNGRIALRMLGQQGREETVTIDLPRPAIAANVLALVTRQQSAFQSAQIGETISSEIAGGLIVMSSISPVTAGLRRTPTSQSPFFRVLLRGERLTPKPGRVDDFRWPRPDDVEPQTDAAPPAAPKGARPGTRPPAKP